jgi:alkylation response protein AidB-like acyl-CoA dehydrogenase
MAQTDVDKGHKGINCLIVEKGMPGFEIGAKENKMGIRGSDTHSLLFTDVKVPKANRIGEDGFRIQVCHENTFRWKNRNCCTSLGNCQRRL